MCVGHRDINQLQAVCTLLLQAKWLDHIETCDTGHLVKWSKMGQCRREMLLHVVQTFSLTQGAAETQQFTESCRQMGQKASDFNDSAKGFWKACLEEVAVPMERESVWTFVRILSGEEVGPSEYLVPGDSVSRLAVNGITPLQLKS
jgi:hypothetical protein